LADVWDGGKKEKRILDIRSSRADTDGYQVIPLYIELYSQKGYGL